MQDYGVEGVGVSLSSLPSLPSLSSPLKKDYLVEEVEEMEERNKRIDTINLPKRPWLPNTRIEEKEEKEEKEKEKVEPEGNFWKWNPSKFKDIPHHWSEECPLPDSTICPLLFSDKHKNTPPLHMWDAKSGQFVWYKGQENKGKKNGKNAREELISDSSLDIDNWDNDTEDTEELGEEGKEGKKEKGGYNLLLLLLFSLLITLIVYHALLKAQEYINLPGHTFYKNEQKLAGTYALFTLILMGGGYCFYTISKMYSKSMNRMNSSKTIKQ